MTKVTDNLDHNKDKAYEFDGIGSLAKTKGGTAAGSYERHRKLDAKLLIRPLRQ